MKRLLSLCFVLFLAACGTEQGNTSGVENVVKNTVEEEPFVLQLTSEKEQYKVGEKPNIKAELIYNGEDESIEIGHGGSWILMTTTNLTEDYHFGAAMNEPYIISEMKKGEPLTEQYGFSGSYDSSNKYSEEIFHKMSEMDFPPGQYEIMGVTDFVIEGEEPSKKYSLKTRVIFEVVEQ